MSKEVVSAKHFCNIGDLVSSMIAIKKYWELTGKKINYLQQLDIPADYYTGAVHPIKDENGVQVMCNSHIWEMIKPLVLSQEYINDADIYSGQKIDIDLTVIRGQIFVNMPHGSIQQWLFIAYPDLASDISKPWINIDEEDVDISTCKLVYPNISSTEFDLVDLKDKCIVNFTERYRNYAMDYFFLKEYEDRVIFSGTEHEYNIFIKRWGLNIPYLKIDNFLQIAAILKKSKFLLSNQSFIWNLAEAMKTPRVLEICTYAANCNPFYDEDSYGYMNQVGLKYYVKILMDKK
jgi:hypothetical protein